MPRVGVLAASRVARPSRSLSPAGSPSARSRRVRSASAARRPVTTSPGAAAADRFIASVMASPVTAATALFGGLSPLGGAAAAAAAQRGVVSPGAAPAVTRASALIRQGSAVKLPPALDAALHGRREWAGGRADAASAHKLRSPPLAGLEPATGTARGRAPPSTRRAAADGVVAASATPATAVRPKQLRFAVTPEPPAARRRGGGGAVATPSVAGECAVTPPRSSGDEEAGADDGGGGSSRLESVLDRYALRLRTLMAGIESGVQPPRGRTPARTPPSRGGFAISLSPTRALADAAGSRGAGQAVVWAPAASPHNALDTSDGGYSYAASERGGGDEEELDGEDSEEGPGPRHALAAPPAPTPRGDASGTSPRVIALLRAARASAAAARKGGHSLAAAVPTSPPQPPVAKPAAGSVEFAYVPWQAAGSAGKRAKTAAGGWAAAAPGGGSPGPAGRARVVVR